MRYWEKDLNRYMKKLPIKLMPMKTRFFIIVVVVLMGTPPLLHAQILNLGIKGGINSNMLITQAEDFTGGKAKIGFVGGLFFRVKSGMLSFQPEALFSHKQGMFTYSEVNDGMDTFFHASFTNIDFPLLISVYPLKYFRFGTGPVVSYPFREKITYTTTQNNQSVTIEKDFFKNAAYSWQLSAAIELGRWVVEGRFEIGIDKLNYDIDLPGQSVTIDPQLKGRTWQFTVGYKFIKPN